MKPGEKLSQILIQSYNKILAKPQATSSILICKRKLK